MSQITQLEVSQIDSMIENYPSQEIIFSTPTVKVKRIWHDPDAVEIRVIRQKSHLMNPLSVVNLFIFFIFCIVFPSTTLLRYFLINMDGVSTQLDKLRPLFSLIPIPILIFVFLPDKSSYRGTQIFIN